MILQAKSLSEGGDMMKIRKFTAPLDTERYNPTNCHAFKMPRTNSVMTGGRIEPIREGKIVGSKIYWSDGTVEDA